MLLDSSNLVSDKLGTVQKATSMQEATESEKGWKYGAGIELVF